MITCDTFHLSDGVHIEILFSVAIRIPTNKPDALGSRTIYAQDHLEVPYKSFLVYAHSGMGVNILNSLVVIG